VREYGHTKKFAKHIVAFAVQQDKHMKDYELAKFVVNDPIGKMLGYGDKLHKSTLSKAKSRSDPEMFADLYNWIVRDKFRNRIVSTMVQDSTAIPSGSRKDRDARTGYRTPSKMEQMFLREGEKTFIFGYKVHTISEAEHEIPLAVTLQPANRNDRMFFSELYESVKSNFRIGPNAKYLADAGYSSSRIRRNLRQDGITAVIPIGGNQYMKTSNPKDPDYGKRWSLERIFSRLKEVFGLGKKRAVGLKRTAIHVYSCLLAYVMRYLI